MANAIYPFYKEAVISGGADHNMATGTVKVALVDTGIYTYSAAHEHENDFFTAIVGTPVEITSKTVAGGLFDGADVTMTSVTGNQSEALIIFIDTGVPSTSPLVAYIDTGVTGLPVTPNGADIDIGWDAAGIFQL